MNPTRQFRQLRNQIRDLHKRIRRLDDRLRRENRRDFFRQVAIAVGVAWLFQQPPPQQPPPPFTIGKSRLDGPDTLGGELTLPDGSYLLLPDGSRLLLPGDD